MGSKVDCDIFATQLEGRQLWAQARPDDFHYASPAYRLAPRP
jgi:hypothetical protein